MVQYIFQHSLNDFRHFNSVIKACQLSATPLIGKRSRSRPRNSGRPKGQVATPAFSVVRWSVTKFKAITQHSLRRGNWYDSETYFTFTY